MEDNENKQSSSCKLLIIRTINQRLHNVGNSQFLASTNILVVLGRLNLHKLQLRIDVGKSGLSNSQKDDSRQQERFELHGSAKNKGLNDGNE